MELKGYKFKQIEWAGDQNRMIGRAEPLVFSIQKLKAHYLVHELDDVFDTLEGAKQAAQSDYEKMVIENYFQKE